MQMKKKRRPLLLGVAFLIGLFIFIGFVVFCGYVSNWGFTNRMSYLPFIPPSIQDELANGKESEGTGKESESERERMGEEIKSEKGGEKELIPRIIHQTYATEEIPSRWRGARWLVKNSHSDFKYMFWTDDSIRSFLEKEYPWILSTFDSYPYPIQRVDAFRYFVLYHYGGCYLDLDVSTRRRLDGLLQYPAILAKRPIGFTNDFMAAMPRHPFFLQLMRNLPANQKCGIFCFGLPSLVVMVTTGPWYLTREYHRAPADVVADVRVMGADVYDSVDGLLIHITGDSWQAVDGQLFSWIFRHRYTHVLPVSLLFFFVLVFFFVLRRRKANVVDSLTKSKSV